MHPKLRHSQILNSIILMKFNFISNIIKQVFQKIITSNLVFSLIVRSKIKDDFILNHGSLISVKNRTQFVKS